MVNYSSEKTIPKLIQQQAQHFPDQVAIQHYHNSINYNDLINDSDQLAACFLASGLKAADIVAVAMDRSIEMSVCLLALLKAEITYVPIDTTLPLERVSFLIKDSGAKKLIVSNKYLKCYHQSAPIAFEDLWESRGQYVFEKKQTNIGHLVYIIYTSGSTGLPKGVGISHQSLLNLLLHRLIEPGVDRFDNMLGLTSMSFDISEEELYLPLIAGAKLTIIDQDIARDGSALLEVVKNEQITIMQATPYIWEMMITAGWKEKLDLVVFCGGEALTKKLAHDLLQRCSALWNMYGPTETTICALANQLFVDDEVIAIGKPISNVTAYVLDEQLNKVADGVEGELYIGGIGVANGYVNREELTTKRFVPDPFLSPTQKMYATGDLVKALPDGKLQFIGRIDSQVKIRGYRIEIDEIIQQIKLKDDIKDALVVVHRDVVANSRLVAYYTLKDGVVDDIAFENSLKESLSRALPAYMVPVDYVMLSAMPLLPSGKIDQKSLPAPNIKNKELAYEAPISAAEKVITEIWKQNIGLSKIGINDNFFDLGGTSLIALKTKIQIERHFAKRLSPSMLFKYPTVKDLVFAIENNQNEDYQSLVAIQPLGNKIPFYMVHGIGLNVLGYRNMVAHLDKRQPVFGLQAVTVDKLNHIYDSIESMASYYLRELEQNQPTGPYAIGGYSIGGIIAFEMAKQLIAKGKEVKLLVMFDTNVQTPTHQYPLLKKIKTKTLRQYSKLKFRLQSIRRAPIKNLSYLVNLYASKVVKIFYKNSDFPNYPKYMLVLINKIMDAFYKYKLEKIPIKIDVFKASNIYYIDDPKCLGWKEYTLEDVNVYNVPGNHAEIFTEPYDKELALQLQKRLDEINAD